MLALVTATLNADQFSTMTPYTADACTLYSLGMLCGQFKVWLWQVIFPIQNCVTHVTPYTAQSSEAEER